MKPGFIDSMRAQSESLRETAHRPWPVPGRRALMGQTWTDLLFAHWRLPPEVLRPYVPPELPLETRDGSAWLGVTPFMASGTRPRRLPPVPFLSTFPEVNVRTYVSVAGRPGIYFFSLDADSSAAVRAARRGYRLPYFRSRMTMGRAEGWTRFRSRRVSRDGPPAGLEIRYRPIGERGTPQPGSLAEWLSERYCLYTLDERGRIQRGEIHHRPWRLAEAAAEIGANTMAQAFGLELSDPPLLHHSARQDVIFWPIRPTGD